MSDEWYAPGVSGDVQARWLTEVTTGGLSAGAVVRELSLHETVPETKAASMVKCGWLSPDTAINSTFSRQATAISAVNNAATVGQKNDFDEHCLVKADAPSMSFLPRA